jgi:hypothetical protein
MGSLNGFMGTSDPFVFLCSQEYLDVEIAVNFS